MAVLGIDIGGHTIKAGIITPNGKILAKEVILTEPEQGRDALVSKIVLIAERLLKKNKNVKSLGIGVPGIVDSKGYIKYTPNIPLSDFNLGKTLKKKLKVKKIVFGNDADNFALAQFKFGYGKSKDTIVALTLGTGVGSGLIIKGKPFVNNGAPELGHTTIKFDGPKANCCHNDGCIESFVGRKSFPEGPLEIYKMAMAGDKEALERFSDFGSYLGIAIANFVNIFNPDLVIIGGQLSNAYMLFKDSMEAEVQKRSLFKTKIVKSKMNDAGIIGAAILAF